MFSRAYGTAYASYSAVGLCNTQRLVNDPAIQTEAVPRGAPHLVAVPFSKDSPMPHAQTVQDLQQLNAASLAHFTAALADVFEHSPWVPERAAAERPFRDVTALHQAMCAVVRQASDAEQMALLRAHPELAGRQAQRGELTTASTHEQARAGLNALSSEEMARITALNAAYMQRHTFPFIVCVGQHTKHSLFAEFERRAHHPSHSEKPEALQQVEAIAKLRLDAMFAAG